jgi:hypothetical protein
MPCLYRVGLIAAFTVAVPFFTNAHLAGGLVKKRRHSLKLEQYSFEPSAGIFSARKVPKKPKWMGSLPVSLTELLKSEEWPETQQFLTLEPT